jgi:hypothetical protein
VALLYRRNNESRSKKCTSQGSGGRSRSTKIAMSTMNKRKKANHKNYRGQGR